MALFTFSPVPICLLAPASGATLWRRQELIHSQAQEYKQCYYTKDETCTFLHFLSIETFISVYQI